MSIIQDCIETELKPIENYKAKQVEYLESHHLEDVDPLTDNDPNTQQIIAVGEYGIESLENARTAMLKVQAFIKRHWPEHKDMTRVMANALKSAYKTEALLKEALEGCQLTGTDFLE